jgi:Domain of unknown function (DUF4440)
MKKLIASVLFACVCIAPAWANSPKAQSQGSADLEAVKQVEGSMGRAMVAGDIDKLKQIYADDFATVESSGKLITKQNLLSDFESFHDKLEWYEDGPMDVRVFSNVAVAQGSVKEKRSRNGKDTSGAFAWMDLLKKRGRLVQSAISRSERCRDRQAIRTRGGECNGGPQYRQTQ